MGRPRVLSRRAVCPILQQCGLIEVRRRGGYIMQRRTDAGSITVPIPNDREIAIGRCRLSRRAGYRELSSKNDLKRVSIAWICRIIRAT